MYPALRIAIVLSVVSLSWVALPAPAGAQVDATPTYLWDQNVNKGQQIPMGSSAQWFCGIFSIQGKFEGNGEKVEINVSPEKQWYVTGQSAQRDIQIQAFCFPYPSASNGLQFFAWAQGQSPVNMGSDRNRLCALASVTGKFEGFGESVEVFAKDGSWWLSGTSQQKHVAATAACINITFSQLNVTPWKQGEGTKTLSSAHDSICVLNRMIGKFEGFGERITLSWLNGNWQVGGRSQQKDVATTAACITR